MHDPIEQLKSERSAARKEVFVQARSIARFKTALLVAVVLAALGLAVYYAYRMDSVPAAADNAGGQAATKEIRRKMLSLEKELELLKAELGETKEKPRPAVELAQRAADFVIANWVLLSFLAAVGTAAYVKWRFKIDYFESYRDLATRKSLAEFYRQLGDRMLVYAEWEAAEAAYRQALEINPTNIQASLGVAKASIFQPMKGQKFYAPEVADAKLDHLMQNAAGDHAALAQLQFLKGLNRDWQGDAQGALACLNEAIRLDRTFVGSHLQLGYMHMGMGKVAEAAEYFQTALSLDPSYALANNNLGYCHVLALRFAEAIQCFQVSHTTAPSLLTMLNLGKAYRYSGDAARAVAWHNAAAATMEQPKIERERFAGGDWIYNFMPLRQGDTETIRRCVRVNTAEQKKSVLQFALGVDHALAGDFAKAAEHTDKGLALDKAKEYREFFANEIDATLALAKVSAGARAFLETKKAAL